jgi:hypothetical protein
MWQCELGTDVGIKSERDSLIWPEFILLIDGTLGMHNAHKVALLFFVTF